MKAISMWQPWASGVAVGSKLIETRHWPTDYRGPLAIHAAKRAPKGELIYHSCLWNWRGALSQIFAGRGDTTLVDLLPFGAIIGVVNLTDCRPSDSFTVGELDIPRRPDGETSDLYNWTERQMGDFSPGRFGWVFQDVKMLKEPIPMKGYQGFFNVPDEWFPAEAFK